MKWWLKGHHGWLGYHAVINQVPEQVPATVTRLMLRCFVPEFHVTLENAIPSS